MKPCTAITLLLVYIKLAFCQEYLACVVNIPGVLLLDGGVMNDPNQTVTKCITFCKANGHTYAGLANYVFCLCGDIDDYDRFGVRNDDDCSVPCPGGGTQTCAGPRRSRIHSVCDRGLYSDGNGGCGYFCHCANDTICRYRDGMCPAGGCQSGWTGDSCQYIDCSINNGGCDHECTDNQRNNPCSCRPGFEQDGPQCRDTDECAEDTSGCNQNCANTIGSYVCRCAEGYELKTGERYTCTDVDECGSDSHGCDRFCTNTDGSYVCSCGVGYTADDRDDRKCNDIDECGSHPHRCDHICTNTVGSYACSCEAGYSVVANQSNRCEDVDECDNGQHDCSQACINMAGTYQCACSKGYELLPEENYLCTASSSSHIRLSVVIGSSVAVIIAVSLVLAILMNVAWRKWHNFRNVPRTKAQEKDGGYEMHKIDERPGNHQEIQTYKELDSTSRKPADHQPAIYLTCSGDVTEPGSTVYDEIKLA